MGAFGFICAAVLLCLLYVIVKWWEKRSEEKEFEQATLLSQDEAARNLMTESQEQNNHLTNTTMEERIGTRDLFLQTLTQLGCQYEIDEDGSDDINFGYQGEYFTVRASNDFAYIYIYDLNWGSVELHDVDEVARLKKAINVSNMQNGVTTIYTIDEAGNSVNVHCKSVILFIPEIPDLVSYLRFEFSDYFRAHETVRAEMAKQRGQESDE